MQRASCNIQPCRVQLVASNTPTQTSIGDATPARARQDEAVVAELLVAFESLVLEDDTSTVLCTPLVIT
jgi:hypothetical protein